ncbi:AbrB family transcriptional regulator [Bradyrhizobium jicamae]|uniref:AbrB family transcriptional regulator n=1 Tax=Bradyrhizobium jicamae TaxID=280332 RepID=A0ABS5FLU2_9BRAD|nr:AbrB family transcriptional regulator [Bradyrhizobium jicamae]MBR0797743.1 AbrB family transcriptional regulator [Bradyrhizobium jicamae]MBR0933283.1 AbrB family transcriptional regulator [Bradyrhizobium jicamae]
MTRASMATAIPDRTKILNGLETLVIGAAGGLLFLWAELPGGLISGAMAAVAIAALAGRPLAVPPVLTQTVLVLLGISLGSLMSRQLLQHMSSYPITVGLLALATFCSTFGSSYYLQRVHGWDHTSALLAGSPGALSQITILAAEKGADVAAIAVVQTIRVIILTAALPLVLALTGITHATPPPLPTMVASPLGLTALVASSVAASLALRWIKFPASWMFGAMLASSLLHGAGLVDGGLPPWLRNVALAGIGAIIGTRFARMKTSTLLGHVNAGLGSFAIAIAISAVFVAVIAFTTNVRLADVVVAFAPGAMDAMLALALTLHIDPIFVGAHHLARFVFVTIATPGIIHLFGRPQDDVDD